MSSKSMQPQPAQPASKTRKINVRIGHQLVVIHIEDTPSLDKMITIHCEKEGQITWMNVIEADVYGDVQATIRHDEVKMVSDGGMVRVTTLTVE